MGLFAFKVGDRVRVLKSVPKYGIKAGDFCEIEEVDYDYTDLPYRITGEGFRAWVEADVVQEPASLLEVRDQFAMRSLSVAYEMVNRMASGVVDKIGYEMAVADKAYDISDAMMISREKKK